MKTKWFSKGAVISTLWRENSWFVNQTTNFKIYNANYLHKKNWAEEKDPIPFTITKEKFPRSLSYSNVSTKFLWMNSSTLPNTTSWMFRVWHPVPNLNKWLMSPNGTKNKRVLFLQPPKTSLKRHWPMLSTWITMRKI